MIIKKIDANIDKKIMFDIVKYEDNEEVFGEASIGNFNISPISKYGMTYVMLEKEEYTGKDDILGVIEIMSSFKKDLAYIYGISISPKHRKKGYAKKLLDYAIKELTKMGIKEIELTVDVDNKIAQDLYLKFNFQNIKVLENEYGDNVARYLFRRVEKNTHYYTNNSNLKSNEKNIDYVIKDKVIKLITDNGVFSKNKVDFGSNLMINTFLNNEKIEKEDKILDYGCGYGVVGISIKALTNAKIYSLDINDRAIDLTKRNFKLNNLEFEDVSTNMPNDLKYILLNPPIRTGKENVFKMYENAYSNLVSGGILYIVIQTKQGAKSSLKKLQELFSKVEMLEISDGYRIYKGVK